MKKKKSLKEKLKRPELPKKKKLLLRQLESQKNRKDNVSYKSKLKQKWTAFHKKLKLVVLKKLQQPKRQKLIVLLRNKESLVKLLPLPC